MPPGDESVAGEEFAGLVAETLLVGRGADGETGTGAGGQHLLMRVRRTDKNHDCLPPDRPGEESLPQGTHPVATSLGIAKGDVERSLCRESEPRLDRRGLDGLESAGAKLFRRLAAAVGVVTKNESDGAGGHGFRNPSWSVRRGDRACRIDSAA